MDRTTAERLFKKHRSVCLPGSGILHDQTLKEPFKSQYFTLSVCDTPDLSRKVSNFPHNMAISIEISMNVSSTYQTFRAFFQKDLRKTLLDYPKRIFSFTLCYLKQAPLQLLKIMRFLQAQEILVFIKLDQVDLDFSQYQLRLAELSYNILEVENMLLGAVSVILSLPLKTKQKTLHDYCTILASIWRRTLPIALGSLIIQDWHPDREKVVYQLHFLKELRPSWLLQFYTNDSRKGQSLACECIGID